MDRGKRNKKVKNRFQFCDRACQTYNRKIRHFGVSTVPPSAVTMTGSVTQWSIHDEFMKEFERSKQERELLSRKGWIFLLNMSKKSSASKEAEKDEDIMHTEEMGHALKIVERMVNLNFKMRYTRTFIGRINRISFERMRDRFYPCGDFARIRPNRNT